jgi:hypothetical protein
MNVHREGIAVFSGEFLRTFSDKKEGRIAFLRKKVCCRLSFEAATKRRKPYKT